MKQLEFNNLLARMSERDLECSIRPEVCGVLLEHESGRRVVVRALAQSGACNAFYWIIGVITESISSEDVLFYGLKKSGAFEEECSFLASSLANLECDYCFDDRVIRQATLPSGWKYCKEDSTDEQGTGARTGASIAQDV